MFNQNEYVNKYIKDNYKEYKLRVKNSETEIIDKLSNVDNVNQYLKELIIKDIKENREYNYIDNTVKIDFKLSRCMQDLVDTAEDADIKEDLGKYLNYADAIDTQAKLECTRGKMTEAQWQRLNRRYPL